MTEGQVPTPPATTPIKPLDGGVSDDGDAMQYYAYNAADRLEYVKERIEEREKAHFNLYLIQVSLEGNPEVGDHHKKDAKDSEGKEKPPCICRDCELTRVNKLLTSMMYAINKLKAVHASLT